MKRFLLALAAVAALTVGSSFTNTAMAHGPGYGHHYGNCGPRYNAGYGGYGYGGGYGRSYSNYPQNFGYASPYGSTIGYPAYGYPGYSNYGYRSGGVIQLYGPRGGFTFGF